MQYRYLGRSGLKVSEICLGTMMFGGATDEATSQRIIANARDTGVNFIDTADMYNKGESERTVGRAIGAERDRWVLATKVGNPMGQGPNQSGMSRKWIREAVHGSLRRLGTDYIDILYMHKADFEAPLEEMVLAFADLIRAGKIGYFAVSNFKAWRLAESVRLAREAGISGPVAAQPLYNLVNREAEVEILPAAAHFGVGTVCYSPLARGILTGKYRPGAEPAADSRAGRADPRMLEAEWRPESLAVAAQLAAYAERTGRKPAHLAQTWVMRNAQVTSTLVGPRTFEQWDDAIAALACPWAEEDEAFCDRLVSPGKGSSLGPVDPHHPIEGRVPTL
ncbi:aldo/keto reductase [Pseudomonas typographi]|uniref:Aldo/keto reductase n=1 Tax=Pseudomonas typographi TaxID=2715964 RepID=A0ABR7Z2H6_9PSED|nr:aldo/keto reductase [Pseudomonas typographi]MBD1585937.1 aldo/keto reductase [Pseudomonas typographi]MBD1599698.1 aldo/keto reductase [Pseudomonas typographi]